MTHFYNYVDDNLNRYLANANVLLLVDIFRMSRILKKPLFNSVYDKFCTFYARDYKPLEYKQKLDYLPYFTNKFLEYLRTIRKTDYKAVADEIRLLYRVCSREERLNRLITYFDKKNYLLWGR